MPEFDYEAPLNAAQYRRLDQIETLLVGIGEPSVAPRAAAVGYDDEEHRFGWTTWGVAAGQDRPFEHSLKAAMQRLAAGGDSAARRRYRFLDRFENRWFRRARTAIRRFVARDQVDAFEAAFLAEMPQQPEGPLVVGSVEKFLGWLPRLKESAVPGARAAHDSLVKKGLTETVLAEVRGVLDEAMSVGLAAAPSAATEAQIAQANRRQQEAYEKINAWYVDWAEVLRSELGQRDLVRLGLVEVHRRPTPVEPEPTPGGPIPGPTP